MKNLSITIMSKLMLLLISLFLLNVTTSHAQIGNLGIYGCAPSAIHSNIFYARLDTNPEK